MSRAAGPPLARAVFDRAAQHRGDDAWLAAAWSGAQVLVLGPGSRTAVRRVDGLPHVALRAAHEVPADATRRFLGVAEDVAYFSASVDVDDTDAGEWLSGREIGPNLGDLEAGLLVTALGLSEWHQRHGFCPRCGHPTVEASAGWVRICTNDGSQHFPRTDPAVIMLIHDGGELALLGRGKQWAEGRFSTLAGFVEPGESLEAAVAREVFEEVGVQITDVRYLASQPWPFPASLMLGFVARLQGEPDITLDAVEMAEAGWFSRDEVRHAADWTDLHDAPDTGARLRGIPPRFSISRYLIDCWLDGEL